MCYCFVVLYKFISFSPIVLYNPKAFIPLAPLLDQAVSHCPTFSAAGCLRWEYVVGKRSEEHTYVHS